MSHIKVVRVLAKQNQQLNQTTSNNSQFTNQTKNHQALLEQYKQKSVVGVIKNLKQKTNNQKKQSKQRVEKLNWCTEYKRLANDVQSVERWLQENSIVDLLDVTLNESAAECMKVKMTVRNVLQRNRNEVTREEVSRLVESYEGQAEAGNQMIKELTHEIQSLYNSVIHDTNDSAGGWEDLSQKELIPAITKEINSRISIHEEYETDSSLRDECINALYNYDIEIRERMKEEAQVYRQKCMEMFPVMELDDFSDEAPSLSDLVLTTGLWSEEDHFHYLKVVKQYKLSRVNNEVYKQVTSSNSFIDMCHREMSHKTREEIELHHRWYSQAFKIYHQKMKSLKNTYFQYTRPHLVNQIVQALQYAQDITRMEIQREQEAAEREQVKSNLDKQLTKLRKEKELRAVEEEAIKQRMQQEEYEKYNKLTEKEQQYRLEQRSALLQHHEEQMRMNQMIQERKREEELEHEERRKQQQEYNAERVAYRKEQQELERERKQMQKMETEEEQFRVQQQLDQLRDQVRRRLQLDRIEADPNRLLQHTEATMNYLQPPAEKQVNMYQTHGYSDEQLMRDKRFKLGVLLGEVGLIQTSQYARDLVKATQPFQAPRRDTLTTDQRTQLK